MADKKGNKFTLKEYVALRKIKPGILAGYEIWPQAKKEPQTLTEWNKSFEAFANRKIAKANK